MSLAERLKKAQQSTGLKHQEFADSIGMAVDRLKNLLADKVKNLRPEEARNIKAAHGIRELWLIEGRGPMNLTEDEKKLAPHLDDLKDTHQFLETFDIKPEYKRVVATIFTYARKGDATGISAYLEKVTSRSNFNDRLSEFVAIPFYDVAASAGPGAINGESPAATGSCFSRDWLQKRKLKPDNLFVIHVTGQSMEGKLSDGDTVLVDKSQAALKSGYAYVLRQGDELLVKYCQLLPDGVLRVSSENKSFEPYDIDLKKMTDVAILGRVVASKHEW